MSENKFAPLMAEFLRNLAQELENNKAMARRLSEPFQAILAETLSSSTAKTPKSNSKQKKYPVPDGFDPFTIFYDQGSPGLYNELYKLGIDELKGVLERFTSIPRKDYTRKQKADALIEMVVQGVKEIATRSDAFGDYKLEP